MRVKAFVLKLCTLCLFLADGDKSRDDGSVPFTTPSVLHYKPYVEYFNYLYKILTECITAVVAIIMAFGFFAPAGIGLL